MPADPDRMRKIEEDHGIPPHPGAWAKGYGQWMDFDLGTKYPDKERFWGSYPRSPRDRKKTGRDYIMIGQSSWNDLSGVEKVIIGRAVRKSFPVSMYAHTNAREYYAEAYMDYQRGRLRHDHIMYEHFKQMPETRRWLEGARYEEEGVPWPAD